MLEIHYPFKPFVVTQNWGNPNPAYKEAGFGFDLHNGIDANVGGAPNRHAYPVYCPVEGFKVYDVRYVPNGGGHQIELISKEPVRMFEKECYAYLIMCHAEKVLVEKGYEPSLGDLLMVADNTGFSTGTHTHIGLYRVEYDGEKVTRYLDTNDANGSFSPALFFTYKYAVDEADVSTLVRSGMRYWRYRFSKSDS